MPRLFYQGHGNFRQADDDGRGKGAVLVKLAENLRVIVKGIVLIPEFKGHLKSGEAAF